MKFFKIMFLVSFFTAFLFSCAPDESFEDIQNSQILEQPSTGDDEDDEKDKPKVPNPID